MVFFIHGLLDVNKPDKYGSTPFHERAGLVDKDTLIALMRHGADMNHFNKAGASPLDVASMQLRI